MEARRNLFNKLFKKEIKRPVAFHDTASKEVESEEIIPPRPADELVLPSRHPCEQLMQVWAKESGLPLPPPLRLCPEDCPLPLDEEQIKAELTSFLEKLGETAMLRLAQAEIKRDGLPTHSLNADCMVYVANGALVAWMLLFAPTLGGKPIVMEQIIHTIGQQGITNGVRWQEIDALLETPDCYFRLLPIAVGTPPVNGKDGYTNDFFPRSTEREIVMDEKGKIDYAAMSFIHNVAEGEVICEIVQPTNGTDGKNIYGEKMVCTNGKPVKIPKGRNTDLDESGAKLIAKKAGHVEYSGRNFNIKPVLELKNGVNYSTGNINFLGDVTIKGDVAAGFTVRAIGSIFIDGVIEGCSIEAGGDVTVVGGVTGQGRAVIRAQRNVFACFLEHSIVYARESIHADCAIDCQLFSDGDIEINSGRGAIIGGTIKASRKVYANLVGSKSERVTTIVLGGLPCESFERTEIRNELQVVEQEIDQTAKLPESPTKQAKLSELRLKLYVAKMKLEKFDQDFAALVEMEKGGLDRCFECGTAYRGTKVTIDDQSLLISSETKHCRVQLVGERIELSTL